MNGLRLGRRRSTAMAFGVGSAIGVAMLALIFSTGAAATDGPAADRTSPNVVYDQLKDAAARGDTRASQLLEKVDAYLSRHGLTVSELGPVVDSTEIVASGPRQLRLKGSPPWSVRVSDDTRIADAESFTNYLTMRHSALRELVSSRSAATIEAYVSPNERMSIVAFADTLRCACRVTDVAADIFLGDEWLMSVGGRYEDVDFAESAPKMEQELIELGEHQLDLFPSVDPSAVSIAVHSVKLSVPVDDALALSDRSSVLLADPVNDTLALFADRAAEVTIGSTPDVYLWHAENVLGLKLSPGAHAPAPQPAEGEG